MGLFRLLLWIAIIVAAVWLWRRFTRAKAPTADQPQASPAPMVRCEHCGVHIPRDHALAKDQHWYCSRSHLEQGPQSSGH